MKQVREVGNGAWPRKRYEATMEGLSVNDIVEPLANVKN